MTDIRTFGVPQLWTPEQRAAQDPDARAAAVVDHVAPPRCVVSGPDVWFSEPAREEQPAPRYSPDAEFSDLGRDPRFPPGWWVFIGLLTVAAAVLGYFAALAIGEAIALAHAQATIRGAW